MDVPLDLAALAGILLLAFFVESALGFGATLIAVSLGALVVPIERLLPLVVGLNLFMSSYVVARSWTVLDRRLLLRQLVPVMGLGMPVGMLLFHALAPNTLLVVFGAFVAVLAALELARAARAPAPATSPAPALALVGATDVAGSVAGPVAAPVAKLSGPQRGALLVTGGVFHGMFATGGPMAVYVASRELPDKRAFRGTLAALWLILNLALFASYVASGALTGTLAHAGFGALLLLAPLVLGTLLGDWAHGRIPVGPFRMLVHTLLLVMGLYLALTG